MITGIQNEQLIRWFISTLTEYNISGLDLFKVFFQTKETDYTYFAFLPVILSESLPDRYILKGLKFRISTR